MSATDEPSGWGPLGPAVSDVVIAAVDAADPSGQRARIGRAIEYLDEAKRVLERWLADERRAQPVWRGRFSRSGIPIIRRKA